MQGKTIKIALAAAALAASTAASALPSSYYSSDSRLASGRWIKVQIKENGIHQISYDTLRRWGFADPSKVTVYGIGGVSCTAHGFNTDYPDDVQPTATMHTADGRILFYAEADSRAEISSATVATVTRNYYDTAGYYFVSDSAPAPEIPEEEAPAETTAAQAWSYCVDYVDYEEFNKPEAGVIYHSKPLAAGQSLTSHFEIEDFGRTDGIEAKGHVRITSAVRTVANEHRATQIGISAPALTLSNMSAQTSVLTTDVAMDFEHLTTKADFSATDGPVDITATVPGTFNGSYAAIDKVYIIYPRINRMEGKASLTAHVLPAVKALSFADAPESLEVWDVSDPTAIRRHLARHDGTSATVGTSGSTRLVAFDPAASHAEITSGSEVIPQNLHALSTPDLLIISTATMLDAARELAEIHRTIQGIDVEVVVQEDVFNEFTAGARHPAAFRRLAKMMYDRNPEKLRWVLLYGPATYDNRGLNGVSGDFLVSFQAEDYAHARKGASAYCGDAYFGMIADSYNHANIVNQHMDVSVGRLPMRMPFQAYEANDKIRRYLANPPAFDNYTRTILMSDDGNLNAHLTQAHAAGTAIDELRSDMTHIHVDNLVLPWDENGATEFHRLMVASLNKGAGFLSYSGHSGENSFGGEKLWSKNLVESTSYDILPITIFASCDTYPFDRLANTIVEKMVSEPNGGSIGSVGACRSVYLDHNRAINTAFAQAYALARPGDTGADIFRTTRNAMAAGNMQSARGANTLCYNYCGDPAVPLRIPGKKIKVTTLGDADAATSYQAEGLSMLHICASVTDASGNIDSSFDGTAIIEIYEAPATHMTLQRNTNTSTGDKAPHEVVYDQNLMGTFFTEVKGGMIDTSVFLPDPAMEGSKNRIVITATDASGQNGASGACHTLKIVQNTSGIASGIDTSAPVIKELYINSKDLVSGVPVSSEFTVFATIDPSASGLSTASGKPKNGLNLVLDGNKSYSEKVRNISFDGDGNARLEMKFSDIASGHHTITVYASNNAGASASESIEFIIGDDTFDAVLTARTDSDNAAHGWVDLSLENLPEGDCNARLLITDAKGRTVLSKESCAFPYRWELTDSEGNPVPDGLYRAAATIANGASLGAAPHVEIVVVR